jgi:hypothetical protein
MRGVALTSRDVEEICGWVGKQIETHDGVQRRELSDMEQALEEVYGALRRMIDDAIATHGNSPDVVLAESAAGALHETLEWARLYRRFATVDERRDKLNYARWSALGALKLLSRLPSE